MDGFFTSITLFRYLLSLGMYAVGTFRSNRKQFPSGILNEIKGKDRGDWVFRQSGELVVVSWMDRKPVNILSSYCSPMNIATVNRHTPQQRTPQPIRAPESVQEYNTNMRAVDIFSQLQSYASIGRKQFRWWPKLAWFLFDIAIMNAYVLYTRQHPDEKISKRQFRIQLAQELVASFTSRKRKGRPTQEATEHTGDTTMHIPWNPQNGSHPCTQCSRGRANRTRTPYLCEQCNVYVCLGQCFKRHVIQQRQRNA
jgi:Transposase IS4